MNNQTDRCRKCKHARLVHLNDADGSQCNYGWLLKLDGTFPNAACHCDEYEPLNNLEYLEYLYEKSR